MSLKVLIVEDDHVVAENLAELLRMKKCEVSLAHDGLTGYEMAKSMRPGLVLLDIILPNKTGYDVCKLIKGDAKMKSIPVLMITAMGKMADAEKAFSAGADGYVIKPIEPIRLLKKIDEILPKPLG